MSEMTKKLASDRRKIAIDDDQDIKYWTRHLGVSREELQRAIDKVGTSVSSVRKELAGIKA
jgi:Protein of unknown function (DUF3606)